MPLKASLLAITPAYGPDYYKSFIYGGVKQHGQGRFHTEPEYIVRRTWCSKQISTYDHCTLWAKLLLCFTFLCSGAESLGRHKEATRSR